MRVHSLKKALTDLLTTVKDRLYKLTLLREMIAASQIAPCSFPYAYITRWRETLSHIQLQQPAEESEHLARFNPVNKEMKKACDGLSVRVTISDAAIHALQSFTQLGGIEPQQLIFPALEAISKLHSEMADPSYAPLLSWRAIGGLICYAQPHDEEAALSLLTQLQREL